MNILRNPDIYNIQRHPRSNIFANVDSHARRFLCNLSDAQDRFIPCPIVVEFDNVLTLPSDGSITCRFLQIYPKHKDLYNWVDVDQRVYVPFNMSYLQESFGYVSRR